MLRKQLPTTMIIVACLGLSACNDKAPEIDSGNSQPAAQATTTEPTAPAAPALTAWSGDLAQALKTELCALDSVNGAVAVDGRFELPLNQPAVFEGWVSTSDLKRPESFKIVLDGDSDFEVTGATGLPRDDVAKAYGTDALATAGFKVELPALDIPAGDYAVTLVHEDAGHAVACVRDFTLSAR